MLILYSLSYVYGVNKIPLHELGLYVLKESKGDEGKESVEFVLAVLRQHEIEFERIISQLEILVDTVNKIAEKLQQKMQNDCT
jgi:hypothetical protein